MKHFGGDFKSLNLRIQKRYHDQLKMLSVKLNCSIREIVEQWCKEKFTKPGKTKEEISEKLKSEHELATRDDE